VWDAASGKQILVLRAHDERLSDVDWSPDGKQIFSTSWDGTIRKWRLPASRPTYFSNFAIDPACAVFVGRGQALAVASTSPSYWEKGIRLWDPTAGVERVTLDGRGPLALTTAEDILASADADQMRVKLWDTRTWFELFTLDVGIQVADLAFSPDGKSWWRGAATATVRQT
jgi:WD40 repeat protein